MKMSEKIITNEEFRGFIKNNKIKEIHGISPRSKFYYYQLMKYELNEDFFVVYIAEKWYSPNVLFIASEINVSGYIHKKTKMIYSPTGEFRELIRDIDTEIPCLKYTDFCDLKFDDKISREITQIILDNWDELKNQDIENPYYDLKYAQTDEAPNRVKSWIVDQNLSKIPDFYFSCSLKEKMRPEDYIEFLSNSNYLKETANQFIERNKDTILHDIQVYDIASRLFDEYNNNPDYQHVRDMNNILKVIPAKTVTIKVKKEGMEEEWQGKIAVKYLKNRKPKEWISMWECSKADRDSFYETFGNSDLFPEDIDEIIFRNKILYKKGV